MPDIDNPDLLAHEQRIAHQIEYATHAYAVLHGNAEEPGEPSNEDVLSLLRFLAEAGFRLEPDADGIMAAARDHMEADKADFIASLVANLPPGVKKVIDVAKEAGVHMAILAVECENPDCPVHGEQ